MIAFDAASGGSSGAATSLTFSHTCAAGGTNRILLVAINHGTDSTDRVTGVTYAGFAMTRIARKATTNGAVYLYYRVDPVEGTNDVVVSLNTSTTSKASSASYTGTKATGQPEAFDSSEVPSGTSVQKSVTTVTDNCWLVVGSYCTNAGQTATNGGTIRDARSEVAIGDSNGPKTPAGSHEAGIQWSGSIDAAIVVAAIAPDGSVAGSTSDFFQVF